MMIALAKQHALIGITTEERDKIKDAPKLIHSLGVIIATVEAAGHGFENDIVLMLGEDCFVEEAITAAFDINGFTIVLLVRATVEELRQHVAGSIDEHTVVRVLNNPNGELPFQLN